MPLKKNIQEVVDNYMCSACGMCSYVCKHHAISFKSTNIGRLIPVVNSSCLNCGLCLKTCPSVNVTKEEERVEDCFIGNIISTFIGRASDVLLYKNAQSGGLCTAIVRFLLNSKSVDAVLVCKRIKKDGIQSLGYIVRNEDELSLYQGSHYVNTNLLSALDEVSENEKVAIIGLPCQIKAVSLYSENTKQHVNVSYKIGLICDRVHCKGYQDTIVSYCKNEVTSINWRRKDFSYNGTYYPYKNAPIVLHDVKGQTHVIPNSFRFAIKEIFTSPRCRICNDKLNINSDIVLGDPWGMNNVDWNHGDSVIIVRTTNGNAIVREAIGNKYFTLSKAAKEDLLIGQFIDERKEHFYLYQKALNALLDKRIANPLPTSGKETKMASDGLTFDQALKDIRRFIIIERLPHFIIIKYAQYLIAKRTGVWHQSLTLLHCLHIFICFINRTKYQLKKRLKQYTK